MTAQSIVEARKVTVTFGKLNASFDAVSDVSVYVQPGEAVGIVGESGSGKTTLARVLIGLQRPSSGEVWIEGSRLLSNAGESSLLRSERWKMQMVFQDPYTSLNPRLRAWQAVAEALQVWKGLQRTAAKTEALKLLASVGISSEQAHQLPRSLSGGQRQRVSVARALAPEPKVIIADEPTSSIDQSAQAQLLNLLRRLTRERGLTIIFISHDLGLVRYLTDRVYVMQKGQLVEEGVTVEVFDHPQQPYTQKLIGSMPGHRTHGMAGWSQSASLSRGR